jgi:hypothetical protein
MFNVNLSVLPADAKFMLFVIVFVISLLIMSAVDKVVSKIIRR